VLSNKRWSANSNDAGEMVTTALPKASEPKHEPVRVGVPAVSLRSSGFRGAVQAVLAALSEVQHLLCQQI